MEAVRNLQHRIPDDAIWYSASPGHGDTRWNEQSALGIVELLLLRPTVGRVDGRMLAYVKMW